MTSTTRSFLRLLVEPEETDIDLVAVHGLNPGSSSDHAEGTWTKNGKLWLKDFLPHQIPNARVLLFSYNANVAFETSAAGIKQQSNNLLNLLRGRRKSCNDRPIVFICHSMGGLVVKKAIVEAALNPAYNSIQKCTKGIVFFGTPHRGGNGAELGRVFANIGLVILRNPSNGFLSALERNSAFAEELADNFRHYAKDLRFISFYENYPVKKFYLWFIPLIKGLVVDPQSAKLGLGGEEQLGLDGNHSDICRYENENSDEYQWVIDNIKEMVVQIVEESKNQQATEAATGGNQALTIQDYNALDRNLSHPQDLSGAQSTRIVPALSPVGALNGSETSSISSDAGNNMQIRLSQYHYTPLNNRTNIRVFVLDPAHGSSEPSGTFVEQPLDGDEYEAISWVWGSLPSKSSIRISGHEYELMQPNLRAALMALRRPHRSRRLWVDALCINHWDMEEKNHTVSMMLTIFQKARRVCVWLGDETVDSRQAMEFISKKLLNLENFDQLVLDPDALPGWSALSRLLRRPWFNRRWIVSEIALARRAVVYCGRSRIVWNDLSDASRLICLAQQQWRRYPGQHTSQNDIYLQDIDELPAHYLMDIVANTFRKVDGGEVLGGRLSLQELLTALGSFLCSEPRDSIYALLPIAHLPAGRGTTQNLVSLLPQIVGTGSDGGSTSSAEQNEVARLEDPSSSLEQNEATRLGWPRVDYSLPAIEVFKQYTDLVIQDSSSLDIICQPWAPDLSKSREYYPQYSTTQPSWLPRVSSAPFQRNTRDIYSRVNADPLVGRSRPGKQRNWTYKASGSSSPTWSFSRVGEAPSYQFELTVEGEIFASISEAASSALEGIIPSDWPQIAGWSDPQQPPPAAFWKTIVADQTPESRGSHNHYQRAFETISKYRTAAGSLVISDVLSLGLGSLVNEYLQLILSIAWGRKMIRTSNDVIGLAPGSAKEGDLVCILYGCSVPIVLRKVILPGATEPYFQLIGDCYLHNFMDGEAVLRNNIEDFTPESFNLR